MAIETHSAESTYITKQNIQHPGTAAQATAAEVLARAELSALKGCTVTAGTIKQGR
jgi:hypothetical protein